MPKQKTKEEFFKTPDPVEMLFEGSEIPVGSKLTLVRYGNSKTLQLFSKHSLDKGMSVLIEAHDLPILADILKAYDTGLKN